MSFDSQRVDEIVSTAMGISAGPERAAYVDAACGEDAALRAWVEALIKARQQGAAMPDQPTMAAEGSTGPADEEQAIRLAPTPPDDSPEAESTLGDHAADEEISLDFLSPPSQPGALGRLAHYEILEVLGKGAFGIVLKAFDEKLHRMVAIKVLSPQLAASGTARRRFIREAQAAAAVRHEHVINIHAVDEQPIPYLVMEYVAGPTLQQKLDRSAPLEMKEILRIGYQIASGLAAAHKQGLVHRDIKPSNILLENGVERVKLTDFGLARAVDDASLTQSGMVAGTPMYMAPEQAMGEKLDHRADLFSLGTVLYVMCTGRPPFRASGTLAILKRVCEDSPRPIREINAEIPEWLAEIIAKLHAKKPEERYQSAQEVADLLARYLAEIQLHGEVGRADWRAGGVSPLMAPPAASPDHHGADAPRSPRSRWRRRVVLAALLLVAVAAVGIWLFNSRTGRIKLVFEDPSLFVTLDGPDGSYQSKPGEDFGFYFNRPGLWTLRTFQEGRLLRTEHFVLAAG
jgi:serine/threonine protein kinase